MLNYSILKDKQGDFSQQIIMEKIADKPSAENDKENLDQKKSNDLARKRDILSSLEMWTEGALSLVKNLEKDCVKENNRIGQISDEKIESHAEMVETARKLGSILKKIVK